MKYVHFIGICGTAMAPIAKMLKDQGWRVTGSDKGIYPPMSDYLRDNGIEFYVGFHPEKIGNPRFAVVGNYIGPSNPEFQSVQVRGIPYRSYPEVLSRTLIKPESIVVAGTYGKTTNAALLAHIWEQAGRNPSYMAAGILKNLNDGVRNTESAWSIVEGDEYPSARWDRKPKFMYYHPKYLLLTGVEHDHLDVYPTEEKYVEIFRNLVETAPQDGLIVAAADRPNVELVLKTARARVIRYGRVRARASTSAPIGAEINPAPTLEWTLGILNRTNGKAKIIVHGPNESIAPCTLSLLGDESLDHIAGAVALARHTGIPPETITRALENFRGVRRRLEVRGVARGVTVIDDFGHSPGKARASLKAVRLSYPEAHIITVYEPNVSSRVVSSKSLYDDSFSEANFVIIPRLSVTKVGEGEETRMSGEELAEVVQGSCTSGAGCAGSRPFTSSARREATNAVYEPSDDAIITRIKKIARSGDVVVFMGSHGFRGMIEQTLKALQ